MIELESKNKLKWKNIFIVLGLQASIIISFSIYQLLSNNPKLLGDFAIYAPFYDIHSYGSYCAALLIIFFFFAFGNSLWNTVLSVIFVTFLFLCVVLSFSRATWLSVIVLVLVYIMSRQSFRKKLFVVASMVMAILVLWITPIPDMLMKSDRAYVKRIGHFMSPEELANDQARISLLKRGMNILLDFPITGIGIGTFYRTSPFYQDFRKKEFIDYYENAHNYFLQLASELGIPAFLIFLSILFCTYRTGFHSLQSDPKTHMYMKGFLYGISAYLITCLTGHPLVLSHQQFLFWFLISSVMLLNNEAADRSPISAISSKNYRVLFAPLVLIMAVGYINHFGKSLPPPQIYEFGFYPYETWQGKKVHWMGKEAHSRILVKGNCMKFEVHAMTPNIDSRGLNFQLWINKHIWDEIQFTNSETKSLRYYVPFKNNEIIDIKMVVSKTFNPSRLGLNSDSRNLGLLVSEIQFTEKLPMEGMDLLEED